MQNPIQYYTDLVEEVLTGYGIPLATARGQSPGQWNLKLGSASIWVEVFQSKDAQGNLLPTGYFQALAYVCDLPINNQNLFTKELLEINHLLYGVAFTIFRDASYIKAIRELEGLDKSEIKATLDRVAIYADDYDDKLKAKYFSAGGSRG